MELKTLSSNAYNISKKLKLFTHNCVNPDTLNYKRSNPGRLYKEEPNKVNEYKI